MRNLLVKLWLAALPACAQEIFHKPPPDVEEALRARVVQFYSLLQEGKFRQAENLVAEESRELFYAMPKSKITEFRLDRMEFAEDFQSAKLAVATPLISPFLGGSKILFPMTNKWKLLDGQWFVVFEKRPPITPFGPMGSSAPSSSSKPESFQRPTLEAVSGGAVRLEPQSLSFPAKGQEKTERTVVISNSMPGALSLEIEGPALPGIELQLSAKTLPASGRVTLQVRFDPQLGKLGGAQQIRLRVRPTDQLLTIPLQLE